VPIVEKKKASSEGLEESLRFTQCMHQMSLVTGQICVETWWFGSTQGCAAKAAGCPSTVEIRKCAVHVKPCLVCVSSAPGGLVLCCLLACLRLGIWKAVATAARILLVNTVSRHVIVTIWPIARSTIGFLNVTSVSLVIAVVMCRLLLSYEWKSLCPTKKAKLCWD
jgi:hypothetical protein